MLAAPPAAAAQTTTKVYRVGTLTVGPPIPPTAGTGAMLIGGLAQRGFKLGQNLAYEARGAAGKVSETANLMQELKAANVDVVVTISYPAAAAAKASGVPTVIASGSGDPVKTGLVASLARPGGNVTGIADDAAALSTKRLDYLKALSPQLRKVAMLWNKDDLGMSQRYDASAQAAQELGVTVLPLGVREPDDFNEAFTAMDRDPPDAHIDGLPIRSHCSIASACSITRLRTGCRQSTSRILSLGRRLNVLRRRPEGIFRPRRRADRPYFSRRKTR